VLLVESWSAISIFIGFLSHVQYSHAAVKVHPVDTNSRIVLDAQIDVLADTEAKVASLRKVLLSQFIFLDFEATLKDLFSLRTSDCDVDGDLFVSSNAKGADCVARLTWRTVLRLAHCQRELE
jgi:hypothetical protein